MTSTCAKSVGVLILGITHKEPIRQFPQYGGDSLTPTIGKATCSDLFLFSDLTGVYVLGDAQAHF